MAIAVRSTNYKSINTHDLNSDIKKGIWLYFLLVIFEGALRKWVAPGLATPLLIIRDPIAIWLISKALRRNLLPANGYLFMMVLIGVLGILTALIFGHGNIFVALYGARLLLLHFPLIFIIGKVMTHKDVVDIGKALMIITIPMTLLVALQFYSPQTAFVNRGVGGDLAGGGYNGGANGYLRPPGTFSFTTGLGQFYGFVGCYAFYFLLNSKKINKPILIIGLASFLFALPLCLSRSVVFQGLLSLVFALIGAFRNPKYIGTAIVSGFVLCLALMILAKFNLFNTATDAFMSRFDSANDYENSLSKVNQVDRYIGGIFSAMANLNETGFFGQGLGIGSNVGSQLISGKKTFLVSEAEFGRWIGELGPILGLSVIFLRISLTIKMLSSGYRRLINGDMLAWMLLSSGFLFVSQGNWAQPTSLGFCTLSGGLMIASTDMFKNKLNRPSSSSLPVNNNIVSS